MTTQEKIAKMRELYIAKHGKEPTAVILGCSAHSELVGQVQFPEKRLGVKTIIIDNDKPNRVELGDFGV